MTKQNEQLLEEARKYIGTKFRDGGHSNRGLDCIGCLVLPAHNLGLCPTDVWERITQQYTPIARNAELVQCLNKYFNRVTDKSDVQVCDVVLFKLPKNRYATHVAYVSGWDREGNMRILHSNAVNGRVTEQLAPTSEQGAQITGIYRLKGL